MVAHETGGLQMNRRRRKQQPIEMDCTPSSICDFLVAKAADRTLAIGPLVWQPSDGTSSKQWYFVVGSGDEAKQFHCDQIVVDSNTPEEYRLAVLTELFTRRPLVVHTFDDEVTMSRWCEALWPCEKSKRIRQSIETDYATRAL
jgi:hypothetical protein